MGKRGPRPTPAAVLKHRGSWRGDAAAGGPDVEAARPQCPRHVMKDPAARNVWRRIVPKLVDAGLLTLLDADVIADYCLMRGELLRCYRGLAEIRKRHRDPVKVATESATLRRAVLDLRRECRATEACFGLNPGDRSRLPSGKSSPAAAEIARAATVARFIKTA